MQGRTRYRYVDFAARAQPGFRNRVVTVDAVPALVAQCGAAECYASVFRFADDILLYLAEHQIEGRPSIAGYDGKVWAPFLALDVDAQAQAGDLAAALQLTRKVYDLLVSRWELTPAGVHVFFSGSKGFHVLVDSRAFGRIPPSRELHRVFSRVRLQILRALPESARGLFDLAIGDKLRLLRLPNTRHGASGLYKIPLEPEELLGCPMAEILALARAPRRYSRLDPAGLSSVEEVAPAPAMIDLFRHAQRAVRRARGPHPYRLGPVPAAPEEALCAARLQMWKSQVPPGSRNNSAIRLASAFRIAGYTRQETTDLLLAWDRRQEAPLPEREIRAVVHSAYARSYPYAFGCHDEVIRAHCPYVDRLGDCEDYRQAHPRTGSA